MMLATRLTSTVVLPLPAPAKISSGPSVQKTACCWTGFNRVKCAAMYWSRRVQNSAALAGMVYCSVLPGGCPAGSRARYLANGGKLPPENLRFGKMIRFGPVWYRFGLV